LLDAIEQLRPRSRLIVYLYYFDEKDIEQVAEELGVKKDHIHVIKTRALAQLREILEKDNAD